MRTPTFLLCGAAKSGTTSLAHYLRQHPDVFVAREKEGHYYVCRDTDPSTRGPGDLSEFAPLLIRDEQRYAQCFKSVRAESAVGEASVYYLYQPQALAAALADNPDMRFVFVLRDPVRRSFSAYSHQRRDGWEPIADFREALDLEDQRVEDGWSWGWHYRRVSMYAPQLRAVQGLIPKEQMHILLYEDLVADPVPTMQGVFAFLGVDSEFVPEASLVLNASGLPRRAGLNRLLTHQNRAKAVAKYLLPYGPGQRVAQRLRNWNLNSLTLDPSTEQDVGHRLLAGTSRRELTELVGQDLSKWNVFAGE